MLVEKLKRGVVSIFPIFVFLAVCIGGYALLYQVVHSFFLPIEAIPNHLSGLIRFAIAFLLLLHVLAAMTLSLLLRFTGLVDSQLFNFEDQEKEVVLRNIGRRNSWDTPSR